MTASTYDWSLAASAARCNSRHAVVANRDARVVARRHGVEIERRSALQQRVELDVLVAAHARVGGAARGVFVQKVGDHEVVELVAQVPHVVRDAQLVGRAPGVVAVLDRAAATRAGTVLVPVAAERHVHANHVVARVHGARGGHGGVDSARQCC